MMAECIIVGNGNGMGEQLGIYPIGTNSRPTGDVTVPKGITSLSRYIFDSNTAVTSVKLPDTLTTIDNYAFNECTNLVTVNIPDSVTSIGQYAFNKCTQIQEVIIPEGTLNILDYCFYNCTSLSKIEIKPTGKVDIRYHAFEGCTSLQNIIIPENGFESLTIHDDAFKNCSALTDDVVNSIFAEINFVEINSLGASVFSYCTSLQHISGIFGTNYLFEYCTGLKTAIVSRCLGNGNSGYCAFRCCSNLETITFGESAKNTLTTISSQYCYECSSLKTIEIPANVKKIDSFAFGYCSSLSNITIDENANFELGRGAFSYCNSLTDDDVQNIVEHSSTIYSDIFSYCSGLQNINIGLIWTNMFLSCVNLQTAYVNSRYTSTGNQVFQNCTSLTEATLTGVLTTMGTAVFSGCSALKKLTLSSTIVSATSSSLTSTSSSYYFLQGCTALEECVLGKDWNSSLRLSVSNKLTVDSMVAMFNNLKDLTDDVAKTLTLGATNLAKLTDEQKAIAINKNWTLA